MTSLLSEDKIFYLLIDSGGKCEFVNLSRVQHSKTVERNMASGGQLWICKLSHPESGYVVVSLDGAPAVSVVFGL